MDETGSKKSKSPGLRRSEPVKSGPRKDRQLNLEASSILEDIPEDREDYLWDNYETPTKQNPRRSSEFSTDTGFNVSAALPPLVSTFGTESIIRDLEFSEEEDNTFASPIGQQPSGLAETPGGQDIENPIARRTRSGKRALFAEEPRRIERSDRVQAKMSETRETALSRRQIKRAKAIVEDDLTSLMSQRSLLSS